jgi:hypothetical protein
MFIKKVSNLLTSTNIIVAVSLVAIILLVYLKYNKFELFVERSISTSPSQLPLPSPTPSLTPNTTPKPSTMNMTTIPATTIPLLNNDIIQNSALVNFINRFIVNKNQQNIYTSTLADRQGKINNLSEQVVNLINPSV